MIDNPLPPPPPPPSDRESQTCHDDVLRCGISSSWVCWLLKATQQLAEYPRSSGWRKRRRNATPRRLPWEEFSGRTRRLGEIHHHGIGLGYKRGEQTAPSIDVFIFFFVGLCFDSRVFKSYDSALREIYAPCKYDVCGSTVSRKGCTCTCTSTINSVDETV